MTGPGWCEHRGIWSHPPSPPGPHLYWEGGSSSAASWWGPWSAPWSCWRSAWGSCPYTTLLGGWSQSSRRSHHYFKSGPPQLCRQQTWPWCWSLRWTRSHGCKGSTAEGLARSLGGPRCWGWGGMTHGVPLVPPMVYQSGNWGPTCTGRSACRDLSI